MTGPHDTHDTHDAHDAHDTEDTEGTDRLERLLLEDAHRWRDGFTPPSLDGALARAHLDAAGGHLTAAGGELTTSSTARAHSAAAAGPGGRSPRATWPVRARPFAVAAAVLVLVGGVVSLVRTLPHSSSDPSTAGRALTGATTTSGPTATTGAASSVQTPGVVTDVPQTWTVGGRVLSYAGRESISSAQVTDRSSSILQVAAESGPCIPFSVPLLTGGDAESVEVTIARYSSAPLETGRACITTRYVDAFRPLDLGAPFGSRRVIDGSTGQPVTATVVSTVPDFTVPSGYVTGVIGPTDTEMQAIGPSRYWAKGQQALTFNSLRPIATGVQSDPDVVLLLTGTVDGHPARVTMERGSTDRIFVSWQPDSTHLFRLTNHGSPRPELTPQQLLAIAQTVTVRR